MDDEQERYYDDDQSEEEPEHSFLKVVLRETDDVVLYECTSTTVPTESEDAAEVLEDNAKYEYLTIGKGKHRPTLDAEVSKNLARKNWKSCETYTLGDKTNLSRAMYILYDSHVQYTLGIPRR